MCVRVFFENHKGAARHLLDLFDISVFMCLYSHMVWSWHRAVLLKWAGVFWWDVSGLCVRCIVWWIMMLWIQNLHQRLQLVTCYDVTPHSDHIMLLLTNCLLFKCNVTKPKKYFHIQYLNVKVIKKFTELHFSLQSKAWHIVRSSYF